MQIAHRVGRGTSSPFAENEKPIPKHTVSHTPAVYLLYWTSQRSFASLQDGFRASKGAQVALAR